MHKLILGFFSEISKISGCFSKIRGNEEKAQFNSCSAQLNTGCFKNFDIILQCNNFGISCLNDYKFTQHV